MAGPSKPASPARDTDAAVLLDAMVRDTERRMGAQGVIRLPCVPDALDFYMAKLVTLWKALGRPFPEQKLLRLREVLTKGLYAGYAASPDARVVIEFESKPRPDPVIQYVARLHSQTTAESFANWVEGRPPPLFGKYPDAKLVDLARSAGEPRSVPFLDVGAGNGRNALAMAARGHPTTAVEVVGPFAQEMRTRAAASALNLDVIETDVESPTLELPRQRFKIALMAEVVTHFRSLRTLRTTFERLTDAVVPGGLVLFNAFLRKGDDAPGSLERQVSELGWASMFCRAELGFIEREFPFELVSDESAYEYERDHLPADGWPPTGWFEKWAQGGDIFDLPGDEPPVELRWLVYRRLASESPFARSMTRNERKTTAREPGDGTLRDALLRTLDRHIVAKGVLVLPCLPAMLGDYMDRLSAAWRAVGRPFNAAELDRLRSALAGGLEAGHRASPRAVLTLDYDGQSPADPTLTYQVRFTPESSARYEEAWLANCGAGR